MTQGERRLALDLDRVLRGHRDRVGSGQIGVGVLAALTGTASGANVMASMAASPAIPRVVVAALVLAPADGAAVGAVTLPGSVATAASPG